MSIQRILRRNPKNKLQFLTKTRFVYGFVSKSPYLIFILILFPVLFETVFILFPDIRLLAIVRDFLKAIFGSKSNLWTVNIGMITALGIMYPLYWQLREKLGQERNFLVALKFGLKHELKSNFITAFAPDKLYLPSELDYYSIVKQNLSTVKNHTNLAYLLSLFRVCENYDGSIKNSRNELDVLKAKENLCRNILYYFTDEFEIISATDKEKVGKAHHRTEHFFEGRLITMDGVEKLKPGIYKNAIEVYCKIFIDNRKAIFSFLNDIIDQTF